MDDIEIHSLNHNIHPPVRQTWVNVLQELTNNGLPLS